MMTDKVVAISRTSFFRSAILITPLLTDIATKGDVNTENLGVGWAKCNTERVFYK
ncbi:MAG: hypothetical protein QNJ70_02215 [Xenococcaceae cyanobacterium MO_207.B15]|nr:hypothetical protein [Xenococcaceae cyanobacterium MO_207.B15]